MDILEPISDEAVTNNVTINPLKSTILTINFLKTPLLFASPIPLIYQLVLWITGRDCLKQLKLELSY